MLTNTTTWEKFSRRNITYLRIIKNDSYNPFHYGYCKNIYLFLCSPKSNKWESIYAHYIKTKHVKPFQDDENNSVSSSSNDVEIRIDQLREANLSNK